MQEHIVGRRCAIALRGTLVACSALIVACGGGGGGTQDAGPSCQNACEQTGQQQCQGSLVQTCSRGPDGCLHLAAATSCPSGQACHSTVNHCVADPCQGIPLTGVCADAHTLEYCAIPTGQGSPRVYAYSCPTGTACRLDSGMAHCAATGSCVPGATACLDAARLWTCGPSGTPTVAACQTACISTAVGSGCAPPIATTTLSLGFTYDMRTVNSSLTDWNSTAQAAPISNLLVMSLSGSATVDAQTTDANGVVNIRVPTAPQASDQIVLLAAASDGLGGVAYAVADPVFPTEGSHNEGDVGSPQLWHWSIPTATLQNGDAFEIGEQDGSGALRVFDFLRYSYQHARNLEGGRAGKSVVVWLGYGASWECGSCFGTVPTAISGLQFDSQVWLDASLRDERWWADPVTAHEAGHWVMASYGVPSPEAGPHYLGVPSYPGMAWSEGWATWHSSDVRGNGIFYDKQNGSFLWVDLAAEQYYSGVPWQLPTPSGGLLQLMDENEVASMLWSLSRNTGDAPLFAALSSPRMTVSPAKRGYTRHTWDYDDTKHLTNVVDTGEPAVCVADFFDALDCAGTSRAVIDSVTVPTSQYPYPSTAPICQ